MKKLICALLTALALLMMVSCEKQQPQSSGFAPFAVRGVTVTLGAEAEPILSALGAPVASAETNSCYGDGKDKIYEYTSFKIQTYSSKGKDYILSVEIHNDSDASVATPEGIRIGSTAEDVLAKQGTPNVQADDHIVYLNNDNNTKLQLLLRDGSVTNIQYLIIE